MDSKWISVRIDDGNRTVSYDYQADKSLRKILTDWMFKWVPDSIQVNGMRVPDSMLDYTLANHMAQVQRNHGAYALRITMVPPAEKKEKKEADAA